MSAPMRCLLDKVVARRAMEGLLKLAEGRDLTEEELWAVDLLRRAGEQDIRLFVTAGTVKLLNRLQGLPRYSVVVTAFLQRTEIIQPTRYFKRWARRLREIGFTREDAHILALASFGTDEEKAILGMHLVVTYDGHLISLWRLHEEVLEKRLEAMCRNLRPPYCRASLPEVIRPEEVI